MKLVLAVVLLCVAYTVADDCDPLQRFKVKHQWAEAFGSGHHRLEFGVKLFRNFFKDHPESRKLFASFNSANVYSPEFEAYVERALGDLDIVIGLMDDKPALTAQLEHLKEQHKQQKIPNEYLSFYFEELLDILPDYLGTKLDFEAWTACTKKLVAAITS